MDYQNTLSTIMHTVAAKAKSEFGSRLCSVILYGSYARSDFDNESDIDIMVVADISPDEANVFDKKFSDFALELDLKNDVVLSIIVQDKPTFERWKNISPFFKNVIKEGINYAA